MRLISVVKFVALVGLFALSACAKKEDTQTVRISFPDWAQLQKSNYDYQSRNSTPIAEKVGDVSSMSASVPSVTKISINVSGSGVKDTFPFSWSREDGETNSAPSEVSLVVPKGALVQVLAIIEGAGATQFFYGDSTVGDADDQTLNLSLSNVAATQGLIEGNVVGRYLTGQNIGPTGVFDYRFSPGNKPSMIVDRGEVFSGWMRAFAFDNKLIKYTWADGTPAFDVTTGGPDLYPTAASAHPERAMLVRIPATWENRSQSGSYEMMRTPARNVAVGYFGPYANQATGNLRICYVDPAGATPAQLEIEKLYKVYDPTTPGTAPSQPLAWIGPNAPTDTDQVFVVDPDAAAATYTTGGSKAAACSTESAGTNEVYKNYLRFKHAQVRNNDSLIDVRGPFVKRASDQYLDVADNGSTVSVSWTFAPGAEAALAGVSVFHRVVSTAITSDALRGHDGLRCGDFRSGKGYSVGFTELKIAGTTASFPVTKGTGQYVQVAVCPRGAGDQLFTSGLSNESSGGGGGVVGTLTQLQIRAPDGVLTTSSALKSSASNACLPLMVEAADGSGNQGYLSTPTTLTLTSLGSTARFYLNTTCSTTPQTSYVDSNYNGRTRIYVRNGSDDSDFKVIATVTSLSDGAYYGRQIGVSNLPAAADSKVKGFYAPSVYAYTCNTLDFANLDDATSAILLGAPSTTTLTLPSVTNLTFYADNDYNCSQTPITTAQLYNATYRGMHTAVRFMWKGAAGTISLTPTSSDANVHPQAMNVTAISPAAATLVEVLSGNRMKAESCNAIYAGAADSNHHPSPVSATTVTVAATNGLLYSSASCSTGGASSITATIAAGSTQSGVFYFKPTASGTSALVATASSLASTTRSIDIEAAVAVKVAIGLPGQTWNSTVKSFVGVPFAQHQNIPFDVSLRALTPDGNVDTSFNRDPGSTASGFDFKLSPVMGFSPSSPSWSAGAATINISINDNSLAASFATGGGVTGLLTQASASFVLVEQPGELNVAWAQPAGYTGVCQPALLGTTGGSGGTVMKVIVPTTITFGLTNAQTYSDASCTTTIPAKTIGYGESSALIYFGIGSYSTYNVVLPTTNGLTGGSFGKMPNGSALGDATQFKIAGFNTTAGTIDVKAGVCQPFMVMITDANYGSVIPHHAVTANLISSGDVALYGDADCSDAPSSARTAVFNTSGVNSRVAMVYARRFSGAGMITVSDAQVGTNGCGPSGTPAVCAGTTINLNNY